jgi:hypothetical protein
MTPIVEAVELVIEGPSSLSLGVRAGEIVGLLFPLGKPRTHVLRVLAGLDPAAAGDARFRDQGRIVIADTARPLSEALTVQPDLVLLDAANDLADRNTWARLASERALGTSFVVATANLDLACRRRSFLPGWDKRLVAEAARWPRICGDSTPDRGPSSRKCGAAPERERKWSRGMPRPRRWPTCP